MSVKAYSTLALTGTILAMAAGAAAAPAPLMAVTGATSQPIGHYEFCLSHADECSVRTGHDVRVRLTPKLWNQLVSVNAGVNLTITPATDEEIFGR